MNRFSDDLETYARTLVFFMCIYMSDFVQIGLWESGQKRGTDGRLDGRLKKDEMVYAIPGKLSERIMLHENLAKYEVS